MKFTKKLTALWLAILIVVGTGAYVRTNQNVTFGTIAGSDVTASGTLGVTGATTLSSTLAVTGASTFTGTSNFNGLIVSAGTASLSGAGAIPITEPIAEGTSSSTDAWTLADGVEGQHIMIVMIVDGGTATLTPANAGGFTSIAFADAGDSVHLLFTNGNWYMVGHGGLSGGPVAS